MTALANALRRMRPAKNRVPHQTGWGTCGLRPNAIASALLSSIYESFLGITEIIRRATPTVLFILWIIFR